MTFYISDTDYYNKVLARMCKARRLLWIATADLKDLYILPDGAKSTARNLPLQPGRHIRFIRKRPPCTLHEFIV